MLVVLPLLMDKIIVVQIGTIIPYLQKRGDSLVQSDFPGDQSVYIVSLPEDRSFTSITEETDDNDSEIDEENFIDHSLLGGIKRNKDPLPFYRNSQHSLHRSNDFIVDGKLCSESLDTTTSIAHKNKKLKINAVTIESKNNCVPLSDQLQMLESSFDDIRCGNTSNEFIKSCLNKCSTTENVLGFNDVDFEYEMCLRIVEIFDEFKINRRLRTDLSNKKIFKKHKPS